MILKDLKRKFTESKQKFDVAVIAKGPEHLSLLKNMIQNHKDLRKVQTLSINDIQGHEFKAIVLNTFSGGRNMLNVNQLNTCFTRAKSSITVIGDSERLCSEGECRVPFLEYIKTCSIMKSIEPEDFSVPSLQEKLRFKTLRSNSVQPTEEKDYDCDAIIQNFLQSNKIYENDSDSDSCINSTTSDNDSNDGNAPFFNEEDGEVNDEEDWESNSLDPATQMVEGNVNFEDDGDDSEDYYIEDFEADDVESCMSLRERNSKLSRKYHMKSEAECRKLMKSEPDSYFRCELKIVTRDIAHAFPVENCNVYCFIITTRFSAGQAFTGDYVLIEEINLNQKSKYINYDKGERCGKVVGVLQRAQNIENKILYCKAVNRDYHLLKPICLSIPKVHVFGPSRNKNSEVAICNEDGKIKRKEIIDLSKIYKVKLLKWPDTHHYPRGFIIDTFDDPKNIEEAFGLLNRLYGLEKLENLPLEKKKLKLDESYNLTVLTIDPKKSTDLDDGLSLKEINAKKVIVGVHIADVTSLIKDGDEVDLLAKKRITSYYLSQNEVVHMLPKNYVDSLSLLPDQVKAVISVYHHVELQNDSWIIKTSEFKIENIKSKFRLNYDEVQCVLEEQCEYQEEDWAPVVKELWKIAKSLRKRRLGEAFQFVDAKIDDPEAHWLVEEFMIATNSYVGKFLTEKNREKGIFRAQNPPESTVVDGFYERYRSSIFCSLYLRKALSCVGKNVTSTDDADFIMSDDIWKRLVLEVNRSNVASAVTIACQEFNHPSLKLPIKNWWDIQNNAFVRSGREESIEHFSLQLKAYTWFTSPIRRYPDILAHRIVKNLLQIERKEVNVEELVFDINKKMHKQKKFQREVEDIKLSNALLSGPSFLKMTIIELNDRSVKLAYRNQTFFLPFSRLFPMKTPKPSDDGLIVTWRRRIYNTKSTKTPSARPLITANQERNLGSNQFSVRILSSKWNSVLNSIIAEDEDDFSENIRAIDRIRKQTTNDEFNDISSEINDNVIVNHHVKFTKEFRIFDQVSAQIGRKNKRKLWETSVKLIKLTDNYLICTEHCEEPLTCFCEPVTKNVHTKFKNLQSYLGAWKSLLKAEYVHQATNDRDHIVIQDVKTKWTMEKDKIIVKFRLKRSFTKPREILPTLDDKSNENPYLACFVTEKNIKRDGAFTNDEESNKYLSSKAYFVAHLYQIRHEFDKENSVDDFTFQLHHSNINITKDALEHMEGNLTLMQLSSMYLRMRKALQVLECKNVGENKSIAFRLATRKETLTKVTEIKSLDYLAEKYDNFPDIDGVNFPKVNYIQHKKVVKAMEDQNTFIWGPPGTGKTTTGVRIAYWFSIINKYEHNNCGMEKKKVLYCGPSNRSVDVVTKMLKNNLSKHVKFVRVYGSQYEHADFRIPRSANIRIESCDTELKDCSLHHLIRQDGKELSGRIKAFDEKFKNSKPEDVTEKDIDEYKGLVHEASLKEIKKYDVILCTTSVSGNDRLLQSLEDEINQCIIDEAGMCIEPETLMPIIFHNPRQTVLIGDHKQLKATVLSKIGQNMDMGKSLFESLVDKSNMLTVQYRMHSEISNISSKFFYDEQITTDSSVEKKFKNTNKSVWPHSKDGLPIPVVFCHLEGEEESLTVSSDEGNEYSKKNKEEVSATIQVFRGLRYKNPQARIGVLSQYRAQCHTIEEELRSQGEEKFDVRTVCGSQGGEWDFVIFSTVRSMQECDIDREGSEGWRKRNLGFITDPNQACVALTRAKFGLIIIGKIN